MTCKYRTLTHQNYQITGEHTDDIQVASTSPVILIDPVSCTTPPKRHQSKLGGKSEQFERGESWNDAIHREKIKDLQSFDEIGEHTTLTRKKLQNGDERRINEEENFTDKVK